MQITDIKTYITMPIQNLPWLFVEVHTDEGITGLGECSSYGNNTLIQQGIQLGNNLFLTLYDHLYLMNKHR